MICQTLLLPLTILVTLIIPIIQQIVTTICSWVSSIITTITTVVSQVCDWLPWPLDTVCDWVTTVIKAVQTVWNFICNTIINTIITIITYILNLVIYVVRIICIIINILIGLPGLVLCLLGLSPARRIRVCIKVLTDERGVSKVQDSAIESSIELMREVYKSCDINVHIDSIERIVNADLLSSTDDSFGGLFSLWHSWFSKTACSCCNQVTVFFLDKITGSSDGFTFWGDNWCRVDATANTDPTIMAHEIGHILSLWHVSDNNDLMFPTSGPPTNPRNTLTGFQCCTMRLSPFVTAF